MFNNLLLDVGLNAFDDIENNPDAPYVAPVEAVVANDLVVAANIAREEQEIAAAEAEVISEVAELNTLQVVSENLDTVSASLEHFIEHGCSPATAGLLVSQLHSSLGSIGCTMPATTAGLENFDDEDAVKLYLSGGLEALNDAKGTIGTRIAGLIVGLNSSIARAIDGIVLRAGRLRKQAQGILADASKASGSRQVKVKNKFLAVKQDKATTNLVGDLANFTKAITGLSSDYMSKMGSFSNGQVNTAVAKLKGVTTLVDAKKIVDGITPPPYPGASVSVKDTPEMTLKRTEVTLGGYAVFDLRYKTTGGDSAPEIASSIKALGKARVTLQRPKEEKGSKVVYEATLTPQDAVKIANEVIKCCDAVLAVQRNFKWTISFLSGAAKHVQALNESMKTGAGAEPGVALVVYTMCKLPGQLVKGVQELGITLPSAVSNVCGAALDVAKQAARGGESAPAKDENANDE